MASFGHFIKEEREKHGWTQTEFGAKIGINAFAISKIENGSQKFSKTKLKELSELNCEFKKRQTRKGETKKVTGVQTKF